MGERDAEVPRPGMVFVGSVAHCVGHPELEAGPDSDSGASSFCLLQNHEVCVGPDGKVRWVRPKGVEGDWPSEYEVMHLSNSQFLVPGFIDTHCHAPQYSYTGTGLDRPLMEWLEMYTFPAEKSLADLALAQDRYERLVKRTLSHGTTCALYFATLHRAPCQVLASICGELGQRALVGKVCMDQNAPSDYRESTEEGIRETEAFIQHVRSSFCGMDGLVLPVITPRFSPTCSEELLRGLGQLANKYSCHVQSHISESLDQVSFAKAVHPDHSNDTELFEACGLLSSKSVMAHGVHLTDADLDRFRVTGAAVAHCALSNFYFAHGHLRVQHLMRNGVQVGLGTDVAGGYSPSMLSAQRMAVVASLATAIDKGTALGRRNVLTFKDAFYLATLGGARALALDDKIGNFAAGKQFDALILDAAGGSENIDLFATDSVQDKLEKILTIGDDRNVRRVYVQGRCVVDKS